MLGGGGIYPCIYPYSQHLGDKGRQISDLEVSLGYQVSSRIYMAITQSDTVSKKTTKKQVNKQTNKFMLILCPK